MYLNFQVINPLVLELGMSEVLETLEAENGGLVADACKKTVKTMLKNAVENVENQILQVSMTEHFKFSRPFKNVD